MSTRGRVYTVLFVFLGGIALATKSWYQWVCADLVHAYGGNVAASFAAFFVFKLPTFPSRFRVAGAAALVLLATELFEATNGFGVMANTYDPADYLTNAIGVGLAVVMDLLATRLSQGVSSGLPRGSKQQTSRSRFYTPPTVWKSGGLTHLPQTPVQGAQSGEKLSHSPI